MVTDACCAPRREARAQQLPSTLQTPVPSAAQAAGRFERLVDDLRRLEVDLLQAHADEVSTLWAENQRLMRQLSANSLGVASPPVGAADASSLRPPLATGLLESKSCRKDKDAFASEATTLPVSDIKPSCKAIMAPGAAFGQEASTQASSWAARSASDTLKWIDVPPLVPEANDQQVLNTLSELTRLLQASKTCQAKADGDGAKQDSVKVERPILRQNSVSDGANNDTTKKLIVTVISAFGLRDADSMIGQGTSDPYCVCTIPGKPDAGFQTAVINSDLNPIWNHEAVVSNYEDGDPLEFSVYDKDPGMVKQDDFLGKATIFSDQVLPDGFNGTLPLTEHSAFGQTGGSTLRVKVILVGGPKPPSDDYEVSGIVAESQVKWKCDLSFPKRSSSSMNPTSTKKFSAQSHGAQIRGRGGCRQRLVSHPLSLPRVLWDLLGAFFIASDIFMVPFLQAFQIETNLGLRMFGLMSMSFWLIDLVGSFFVGYQSGGVYEMRPRRIASHYIKSWFIPDLALVSIDLIFFVMTLLESAGEAEDSSTGLLRIFRSMRALRSLRALSVLRLAKKLRVIEVIFAAIQSEWTRIVVHILVLIGIILSMSHLVACAWHAIGLINDGDPVKHQDSWIYASGLHGMGVPERYFISLHWAWTQFTPASTNIHATNLPERIYNLLIAIGGLISFSFFVSTITGQLAQLKRINRDRIKQDTDLRRYFSENQISLELSKVVFDYLRFCRLHRKQRLHYDEVTALKGIPEDLRAQLHMETYLPKLRHHPFFACLDEVDHLSVRKLCSRALQEAHVPMGTCVFTHHARAQKMYFVYEGELNYQRPGDLFLVSKDQWLSEAALWIQGWFHRGRLVSASVAEFIEVNVESFQAIVAKCSLTCKRGPLVYAYAAKFVRSGELTDVEHLRFSDIWATSDRIEAIVREASLS